MGEALYMLVLDGGIAEGQDEENVKRKLAELFNADLEQIEHLMCGSKKIIKSNLDHETATKLKAAFERTGALCEVEALPSADAPPQ